MLQIRSEQLEVIARAARKAREDDVIAQLRETFPHAARGRTMRGLRMHVRAALAVASIHVMEDDELLRHLEQRLTGSGGKP
jgi:hypothetical protein